MYRARSSKQRYKDESKVSKEIAKFNAKRTRLINQVPELAEILPSKLNVSDTKSSLTSRKKINDLFRYVNNFMKKDATKIVVTNSKNIITKFELQETKLKLKRVNARRETELKESGASEKLGTRESVKDMNLRKRADNITDISPDRWSKYVASLDRELDDNFVQIRNERYMENYFTALETAFGSRSDVIKEKIKNLSPDDFINMYYSNPFLSVSFIYDEAEIDARISLIEDNIDKYVSNKV